jgi:hypothetical protein
VSVAIGLITQKDIDLDTVICLLEVQRDNPGQRFIFKTGIYLDDLRNVVVREFMELDDDWLLFWDSDVTASTKDIATLLPGVVEPENRCVTGIYLRAADPLAPVVYDYNRETLVFDQIPYEDLLARPRDDQGYVSVDAAGCGFMAIHRTLLQEMLDTWDAPCSPFAEEVLSGVHLGEDFTFCARLRAMGYHVLVQPDVKLGHLKYVRLHIKD